MHLPRALFLALSVLLLAAPLTHAQSSNQAADTRPYMEQLATVESVTATAAAQPGHHDPVQAAQVMLLTGLVVLAALGIAFVIYFVRWITGKVHIPTEEEYQAAQHAIHGAEH
jgi:hypothetical protein